MLMVSQDNYMTVPELPFRFKITSIGQKPFVKTLVIPESSISSIESGITFSKTKINLLVLMNHGSNKTIVLEPEREITKEEAESIKLSTVVFYFLQKHLINSFKED